MGCVTAWWCLAGALSNWINNCQYMMSNYYAGKVTTAKLHFQLLPLWWYFTYIKLCGSTTWLYSNSDVKNCIITNGAIMWCKFRDIVLEDDMYHLTDDDCFERILIEGYYIMSILYWGLCCYCCCVNRIPAMAPYTAPPFWGANYKGTYLPQNRVHSPHLEGERYSS